MKTYLFSFLVLFISFIILSSCNEDESSVSTTAPAVSKTETKTSQDSVPNTLFKGEKKKEWPTEIYDSVYGKIILDTNLVSTRSMTCGIKFTTGYGTHHYEPKPGKLVGVWPKERSNADLIELRTKFGYGGIFCQNAEQYDTAISCGFSKDNIILDINYEWYQPQQMIDKLNSRDARYYYIDEAVNHACFGNCQEDPCKRLFQQWEFPDIVNNIDNIRPGSFFVSSGYKWCHHMAVLTQYTDIIMFSGYINRYLSALPYCNTNMGWPPDQENTWVDGADDQRPAWSEFRNRYASKFSMTWINTTEYTEFNLLFGHAQNLGLYGIWAYSLDGHHTDQWENISQAAWMHGFLRRFVQDYRVEWRCIYYNDPCAECNPNDPNAVWYIYNITPIPGTVREIFY